MIIKTFKERDYASIENKVLNDKRLSYRARGILAYLLSKPSGWTVRSEDIVNNGTESRGMIRTCFRELKRLRYARLVPNPTGGSQWIICEDPGTRDAAYLNLATEGRDITKSDAGVSRTLSKKEKSVTKTDSVGFLISGQADRIAALFKRRETTPWSPKEVSSWKKLTNKGKRTLDDDELTMVERYYAEARRKNDNYCRRDLYTFLNNYAGEVDRARSWCEKHPLPGARKVSAPRKEPEIVRPPEDPAETKKFCENFERQFHRLPAGYKRDGEEIIFIGSNGAK